MGLPSYRNLEDSGVAAGYQVWVRTPDRVRPGDGVDYDQAPTEHLPPSPTSMVREVLGERRPSGWVRGGARPGGAARAGLRRGTAGRAAAR
ncbi:hypothetical protein Sfulv_59410 [Streptomyces fulvorobeus]|uniref:Uncharacterized protein n=1 Tax=Streptomyces fulvorobeus TaxID=284028 RepID=A0A7J0CF53_9ACTN|nr:hypothetical protein Sfulv_59410 [Streptomyces fulvorobeus]